MRNKTISLNICIDVREVFNAKVENKGERKEGQKIYWINLVIYQLPNSNLSMVWITVILSNILIMFFQVVRETVWSSLDSSPGPGTDLLTLAKTSNLSDLQVTTLLLSD